MTVSPSSLERLFRKQKVPHKLIALCSFKEVRENFSEEMQFSSMSISQNHFAPGGKAPWTSNGALPLYVYLTGGLSGPQTPCLCKVVRSPVPSTFTLSPPT